MFEYHVQSKWIGWGGGFGSEGDIADIMEAANQDGWRLIRTEVAICRWWVVPRHKFLMVFERPAVVEAEIPAAPALPEVQDVAAAPARNALTSAASPIVTVATPAATDGPFVRNR